MKHQTLLSGEKLSIYESLVCHPLLLLSECLQLISNHTYPKILLQCDKYMSKICWENRKYCRP